MASMTEEIGVTGRCLRCIDEAAVTGKCFSDRGITVGVTGNGFSDRGIKSDKEVLQVYR